MNTKNQTLNEQTQTSGAPAANDPQPWKTALPPRANGLGNKQDDLVWRPGSGAERGYERSVSEWWWI